MQIEVRALKVGMIVSGLKVVSIKTLRQRRFSFDMKIGFQDNTGRITYNIFDGFSTLNGLDSELKIR